MYEVRLLYKEKQQICIIWESTICQHIDSTVKGLEEICKEEIQEEGSIIEDIIEENQCSQEIFKEIGDQRQKEEVN